MSQSANELRQCRIYLSIYEIVEVPGYARICTCQTLRGRKHLVALTAFQI